MKEVVRVLLLTVLATTGSIAGRPTAVAELREPSGDVVGRATFQPVANGVLIQIRFDRIAPGPHAIHIHENGSCEPDFTAAGGHFNPDHSGHGLLAGPYHAGDMPNFDAPASGSVSLQIVNTQITFARDEANSLFKPGGTALIVHDGPDDYRSPPSGAAGKRIACGVIEDR